MRRLALGLLAVALAACSGRATGDPSRDLQWRSSVRGNEIRVVAYDRTGAYRIERIALAGPNGVVVPARELTRESQRGGGPGLGVGGDYGSRRGANLGIGMSLPVDDDIAPSLERRTAAVIPVPSGYAQNASQWRIEADVVVPRGGPAHLSIPAPAP